MSFCPFRLPRLVFAAGALFTSTFLAGGSAAADTQSEIAELKRRLLELEKKQAASTAALEEKTDAIAEEVQKGGLDQLLPEKAELKSEWGMGPAASGVYRVKQGVSLGAYGEATYRNFVQDQGTKKDQADYHRLVTYLGYKFDDTVVFNSEIEFEHTTTGEIGGDLGDEEGEVSVEFAYLDFLHDRAINSRAGLVLIPMGLVNELHEPNTFHGVRRPEVESVILPSTWRELGVGLFGEGDAAGKIAYRTYLVNGLRASRFSDGGIRDGRQKGNRAVFEDVAWTGRLDYSPEAVPGLMFGGSFWFGNSGQDDVFLEQTPSVFTSVLESHAQWRFAGVELRALGAWGSIDDADLLSAALEKTIAEDFHGWYVELAYDVMPLFASGSTHYLAPFVRFESFDTQATVPNGFERNESQEKDLYVVGLSYKPIPKVVLKLDYRNFDTDGPKKTADEVALGVGFAF